MNTATRSIGDIRGSRIGIAMMLVGALLVAAGIVQTTSSHNNGGNQSCPEGSVLIAKFNYNHGYVFEKPAGNENVVTLSNTSSSGAAWHSTLAVSVVIVKGGTASFVSWIAPPQFDGNFSNAGLPPVGSGNTPAVSNVQFCGPNSPVSSSSSSSTSSSTSSSSSSTSSTSSTSTSSSTSTTATSTTTVPVTTTTKPHATTTTTVPRTTSTTTTTQPESTTTAGVETTTTTTTIPESTTTERVAGSTVVVSTTTTTSPFVTSTTVVTGNDGTLPFTGGQSAPLIIAGILFLAAGFALKLSSAGRSRSSRV